MSTRSEHVCGAIIAGGASTRFGSPKALAEVGGVRVIDRVARTLEAAAGVHGVFAIVNDPGLGAEVDLPHRPDVLAGAGALAGVHAALLWARELDRAGVIAAGCDMPFLSSALLSEVLRHAHSYDVVIPESDNPRGVEPLCAFYGPGCITPIEAAIARGDARMVSFHEAVHVHRIPLDVVRSFGDPAVIFMNMNTQADLAEADRIVRETS
ncbi:MAG TPA: molybdenum cofactor guanylyltransferase [Longimicrobiales bacterium]|nr:molybdenum cofactor guanylyltransferase [Longimicrobiales bacterium]